MRSGDPERDVSLSLSSTGSVALSIQRFAHHITFVHPYLLGNNSSSTHPLVFISNRIGHNLINLISPIDFVSAANGRGIKIKLQY